MKYLFHLGHTPRLASLEIASYLTRKQLKFKKLSVTHNTYVISTKKRLDLENAISTLGGTVRIARYITHCKPNQITQTIARLLSNNSAKSPAFSLAAIGRVNNVKRHLKQIKTFLKQKNIPSRFILPKDEFLTPIQIKTQKVNEFILVSNQQSISLFQTQVVSNYKHWISRDRHRPHFNARSGMLPPKVARMILNLGFSKHPAKSTTILDPFCGSGTILAEAVVLGVNCIGSDISPQAVNASKQNLAWIKTNYDQIQSFKVIAADASKLTLSQLGSDPVDAIVTEGYLGPPNFSTKQLPQLIQNLHKFYLQTLPNLQHLLKPNARLVIALPKFNSIKSVKMLSSLIDSCENSGYTRLAGPINYSKPKARIKRAIYILQKTD